MQNTRFFTVIKVWGMLLIMLSLLMFLSSGIALIYKSNDILPLIYSGLITLIIGIGLRLSSNKYPIEIDKRMGFFIVSTVWIIVSIFGLLPYWLSGHFSFSDAFFETISGFTTTGATCKSDVELIPKGLLFYRSLTNWTGGIGIVVIVLSVIPFIGSGGMSLYAAEVPGPAKSRLSPKIGKTGKIIFSIYFALTAFIALLLWLVNMDFFDAVCHSFTVLGSGGFSTKNDSAAAFSPLIQYVLIFAMIPSGINLTLFYYAIKKNFKVVRDNDEFKTYLVIMLVASIITFLFVYNTELGIEASFRHTLFQIVSVTTSTGYVTADYTQWHQATFFIFLFLMFTGAMSGSTTGGFKLVRVILLFKNAKKIIRQNLHSNAFIPVRLNKKVVDDNIINNVRIIFLLYILTFFIGLIGLLLFGFDLSSAIGGSISCLSNMGIAFGSEGGFGNFYEYSTPVKWFTTLLMYLGRLEMLTVYVLFFPSFWKR